MDDDVGTFMDDDVGVFMDDDVGVFMDDEDTLEEELSFWKLEDSGSSPE